MSGHKRHNTVDMGYIPSTGLVEYRTFTRNTAERASTGLLKQPRLPGAEKFRFTAEDKNRPLTLGSNTLPHRRSYRLSNSSRFGTVPGAKQDDCETPAFGDSKRRPIIPISRNTSRVLNNTNVELSADAVEFIRNETSRLSLMCQRYVVGDASHPRKANSKNRGSLEDTSSNDDSRWSRSSSEHSMDDRRHQAALYNGGKPQGSANGHAPVMSSLKPTGISNRWSQSSSEQSFDGLSDPRHRFHVDDHNKSKVNSLERQPVNSITSKHCNDSLSASSEVHLDDGYHKYAHVPAYHNKHVHGNTYNHNKVENGVRDPVSAAAEVNNNKQKCAGIFSHRLRRRASLTPPQAPVVSNNIYEEDIWLPR